MSPVEPTIISTSDASAIEIEIARRNAVIISFLYWLFYLNLW
jgi:hypothetical protein